MCNCNNNNPCIPNQTPCPPQVDCTCPVLLNTSCVTYDGDDLECANIESGLPLNQTIKLLDEHVCEAIAEINSSINLINVGTGEDIYAGIDGIGRRKIKRVNTDSNILTITPNTDDITFGIDEEELNNNINITNVGSGVEPYKGYNPTTSEHEFRTVVQEDQGTGVSFLRDIEQTTDELKVRVKTLVSDNLTITTTDEEVRIEVPTTASIPGLYVNNLYIPTYQEWLAENTLRNSGTPVTGFQFRGKGTLSQPFTDTIVYTLNSPLIPPTISLNTAIQNSLDGDVVYSYVGGGTRLNPQRQGQKIIIQSNNVGYIFAGNLNYQLLNLEVGDNIICTTSGYLLDMEDSTGFDQISSFATITINEGKLIDIQGLGFRNNGNNISTSSFQSGKIIQLLGRGDIRSTQTDINRYIINSDVLNSGNNNDGNLTFNVSCNIRCDFQGVYKVGGRGKIDIYGELQSGTIINTVDTTLKAFHQTGGQVRIFNTAKIIAEGTTRDEVITFEPSTGFTPVFIAIGSIFGGIAETLFSKLNNNNVTLEVTSSQSGYGLSLVNIFNSTNMWEVIFKNNIFSSGTIDFSVIDLTNGNTISSTNTIGNNLVETLVAYENRAAAILAGVPIYSAFINKNGTEVFPTTVKWVRDIVLPA